METSPTVKDIASALKKFHEYVEPITKDAVNPHFKSKFASLDNIIAGIRNALAIAGLSFAQFPDGDGLTTILMHTSGEWLKATANLKLVKQDPQGQGSAYTYARRYALSAVLGLATDEDDDGNEASKPRAVAKPVEDTPMQIQDGQIIKMAGLVRDLGYKGLKGDVFKAKVKELTELDCAPKNYIDIIGRLETLLDEAKQK